VKDATGAAGRLSRRRHHERHGYDGVQTRWHEYRATAGDVKTRVVSRGVDTDQQLRVMPHRDAVTYEGSTRDAYKGYAVQSASFRTGVKDTLARFGSWRAFIGEKLYEVILWRASSQSIYCSF
jgi:hypothetical protein